MEICPPTTVEDDIEGVPFIGILNEHSDRVRISHDCSFDLQLPGQGAASSRQVIGPESSPAAVQTGLRRLRELSARLEHGPWWRFLLWLSESGETEFGYDYGDEPFPDGQLFAPEIYRSDLEAYPRQRLPVWFAAYVGHGDRQTRGPRSAVTAVRAGGADGCGRRRCRISCRICR
ncbi:hypothetical protein ACQPZ2_24600 [Nocardia pseudovaccinii]|uniref:hypothetical protein n=1 Tax=Nocardia pseudovaccinii TaxID=189540 RepID=UPI003D8E5108